MKDYSPGCVRAMKEVYGVFVGGAQQSPGPSTSSLKVPTMSKVNTVASRNIRATSSGGLRTGQNNMRPLPAIAATREAIAASPVFGNAHHDMPLMKAIDTFVRDPSTTTVDKLWALNRLSNDVMGLGEPPCTEADLSNYIAN